MIYSTLSKKQKRYYEKMLKIVGSLSRLFSDNDSPYIDSRVAENLFCKAFKAENKGRDDSSADAVLSDIGIGIKTFVGNSNQKISEFNKELTSFSNLDPLNRAIKISELRNKRIEFTKASYGLKTMIYHLIKRKKGRICIYECDMDKIDTSRIRILKSNSKTIQFTDGEHNYNFNISKSVLQMRFPEGKYETVIDVKMIEDPFELLEKEISLTKSFIQKQKELPYLILPMYSYSKDKKIVPEKSGLNQWNAKGRDGGTKKRHEDELYIPIPSWIHKKFRNFFPSTRKTFSLELPDNTILTAKVCQANGKALMSNPNKKLGKWILRDILKIPKGRKVTYKMLEELGVDSVIVKRRSNSHYIIDFRKEGEFEKFRLENLQD